MNNIIKIVVDSRIIEFGSVAEANNYLKSTNIQANLELFGNRTFGLGVRLYKRESSPTEHSSVILVPFVNMNNVIKNLLNKSIEIEELDLVIGYTDFVCI